MRKRTLADWKGIYVTWRNVAEMVNVKNRWLAVRYRNNAKLAMRRLEAGVLVCLMLLIMAGGCMTGRGLGTMVRGLGQDVETLNDGYMKANK